MSNVRYDDAFFKKNREHTLKRVEEARKLFDKTKTFHYPTWLYGDFIGKPVTIEVEDCPRFGDTAYVELDSARTAFLSIDMQKDFCGRHGYVDVMGYDLHPTQSALKPIKNALEMVRKTDMPVIHTREGHMPDLSDAAFNKILRSKIIGDGVGIGDTPPGGMGKLLVRGEANWDIHEDVYPIPGEYIIDKAGKGAFGSSTIHMLLKNLGVTHLILSGITTDVCVQTIMREANDYGYWCILMKDGTGATDEENHASAIKSIKMQGGVFGNVTDSKRLINALDKAFNK